MDPYLIIEKYYPKDSLAYSYLVVHSELVTEFAVEIALRVPHLNPDVQFIKEAAMLHDIGIFLTDAPSVGCFGNEPYIKHGILGRNLLEKEGYPKHAMVCETHIGVGLTIKEITENNLPLPLRNMSPQSIEEKIICYADNFYSKSKKNLRIKASIDRIEAKLLKYGSQNVTTFRNFKEIFGV